VPPIATNRVQRNHRSFGWRELAGRTRGKSRLIPSFLLLLAPCTAFPQDSPRGGEYKISTHVELVLLDVSVKDAKGGYVSGLTKENFRIYENDALQRITAFAVADVPVAVGLVMDNSGSMQPKRPELITAGVAFVGASNPLDQIFVINFNDKVTRGLPNTVPFTDDVRLLRAALSKDRPEGRTALYDAIAFALNHLESGRRDKKTLVVVSDGGDNCSTRSFKELLLLIQEARATIYTVGLFDPGERDNNPGILKRIASLSGGECFLPAKLDEIVPTCQKIAKDIRNRYTMGYLPVRTNDKAAQRRIRVVAVAADHKKLVVRTRTSYSLPERITLAPTILEPSR
jgi:Ca-activated chloride channel homolog